MGSALKAEVKIATAHEIGVRVDDMLDAAKRDLERSIGAQSALTEGAKLVQSLHAVADKEIDQGALDLETAKKVKQFVTRAVVALEMLAQKATNIQQVSHGRVQGLQAAVSSVKTFSDQAEAARAALVSEPSEGEQTLTPASGSEARPAPGLTIKQRRLAEDGKAVETPPARKRKRRR